MQIRLADNLSYDSIVDGPGLRMVVWAQGCYKNCKGCHNPQTHDFTKGILRDVDDIFNEIIEYPLMQGVTFSGGEPFAQPEAFAELARKLKEKNINVWSFSGYTFEELSSNPKTKELLEQLDVLVDGEFVEELKSDTLVFRGSSNQRIIDVQTSLKENKIVIKGNKIDKN